MTNHTHIVAVPETEDSLAGAIGRTHFAYTQYVNRLHDRSGHLWQNRFYSCALDDVHLWRALRYVERNPVRARLVRVPWRYPWSSAAAHVSQRDDTGLLDLAEWRKEWKPEKWRKTLREPEDDELIDRLRRNTMTGRPLATDKTIARLERRLGRRLRPLPVGRPKKAKPPRTKKVARKKK
jgi:putative transposase